MLTHKIKTAPTGNLITGHVLDANPKGLEQALKLYDSQLYLKWNSKKLRGWGCWEVRYKPELKSVRLEDTIVWQGNTISVPKYHELDLINHVMDVPFVNYSVLEKIKKMDMWTKDELGHKGKNLTNVLHYNEAKHLEKVEDKALKELDYNLKQHKSEIRWFKDYVNAGQNPYRIADHWGQ